MSIRGPPPRRRPANCRLLRERADLLGEAALVTRSLVAVNDALVHHAVDHGSGGGKCGGRLFLLAGLERQGRLADGAAQLRGERVVTGSMHRRLPCSLFSRFRIRQAQTPYGNNGPNRTSKEPRSLPIGSALVNDRAGRRQGPRYSGSTESRET